MSHKPQSHGELIPQLFRQEYTKITAVLCANFGLHLIDIAEDIASETFLKASENWAMNGVPQNPTGWLYTVAKNKAKDHLKHNTIFKTQVSEGIKLNGAPAKEDFEFSEQNIEDSQLLMIFAVCNPINSIECQICLALQILCGFNVEEIANAFLSNKETIKKRLHRGRCSLRKDGFKIKTLSANDNQLRLGAVLKILYLLFNEGYFSKTSNRTIRKELCFEAIRLTLVLKENSLTDTAPTSALLALMCYQSSRLEARINNLGEVIPFDEQDKNLWDQSLIEKGNYYLVNACIGNEISEYHLEAGIAYWHTTTTGENKWQYILQLYNQLILIAYSPITALNRTFAFAKVHGQAKAIAEAEKLKLTENNYYHEVLGYLYEEIDIRKAINHYEQAVKLTKSKVQKQMLLKKIQRMQKGE